MPTSSPSATRTLRRRSPRHFSTPSLGSTACRSPSSATATRCSPARCGRNCSGSPAPSSAFHPQTDGQSEVANKIITAYLHCLASDRPRSWLRWLPWAEFCFNSSYQTALKATPFKVVYGRVPPPLFPYQAGMTRVVAVDRQLQDRDEFLIEIKNRLLQSQALMKQVHDQRRSDMEFAVGNWVWLHLNQRAATSVRGAGPSKLSAKFFGPYQVTTKIGSVSYRLQLPPNAKIHNVFHVVFLKKFEGSPPMHTP
jgi:hypothetical protein